MGWVWHGSKADLTEFPVLDIWSQFSHLTSIKFVASLIIRGGELGILQIWVIRNNFRWEKRFKAFFPHCLIQHSVETNVKETAFQENNFYPALKTHFTRLKGNASCYPTAAARCSLPSKAAAWSSNKIWSPGVCCQGERHVLHFQNTDPPPF